MCNRLLVMFWGTKPLCVDVFLWVRVESFCVCTWEKLYSRCLFRKAGKKRAKASTITGIILNILVNSSTHLFAASYAEPPSPPSPLTHTCMLNIYLVNYTFRIVWECIGTTRHFPHRGKKSTPTIWCTGKTKTIDCFERLPCFLCVNCGPSNRNRLRNRVFPYSCNMKSWHFCIAST